jgi:hypothetical protein
MVTQRSGGAARVPVGNRRVTCARTLVLNRGDSGALMRLVLSSTRATPGRLEMPRERGGKTCGETVDACDPTRTRGPSTR